MFADDTSLFSKVLDVNESTKKLNFDLEKISEWAFQLIMHFNPVKRSRLMKSYFLENQKSIFIPLSLLTIMMLSNVLNRNI